MSFEKKKFDKFFKLLDLTKKNVKTEIKNGVKNLISFMNTTKIPNYKKTEVLSFMKENWEDMLNSEYRVTTHRREKIYEILNILEGNLETTKRQSREKPEPNFYESGKHINSDSTGLSSKGFKEFGNMDKDILDRGKKDYIKNFPKSSPPKKEMKTNLINLDTSRDNLIVSRAHFNPKAAQIRSMAILNSENKENMGFGDDYLKSKLRKYDLSKMSKISGFKDPLRSKISDYADIDMELRTFKGGNYPYTLDNIREEGDSFEHYSHHHHNHHDYLHKYHHHHLPPHVDLETSSNRNQNRGFNQYLQDD